MFKVEYDPSVSTDAIKVGEADKGKPDMTAISKTNIEATAAAKYEYRTAYTGWASIKGTSDVVDLSIKKKAQPFLLGKRCKIFPHPSLQKSTLKMIVVFVTSVWYNQKKKCLQWHSWQTKIQKGDSYLYRKGKIWQKRT